MSHGIWGLAAGHTIVLVLSETIVCLRSHVALEQMGLLAHMQALVVSSPGGIGAGAVIEAAEEAEEHLQHSEPLSLYVTPKVCCHAGSRKKPSLSLSQIIM